LSHKQLLWAWQVLQSCRSQLHTLLYLPKATGHNSTHCCTFPKLQVTTPHTAVPSHNNSYRGSNLRSTLYIWSSSWCGLIILKFLSLQFLAKCPYLSHNQRSVSFFSSPYNCPNSASIPLRDCSTFRIVELTINQDIHKHVPLYHVTFRSRCIQQSMNQFSTTQQSVTTAVYVQPR
jgi:hypothetical protein